MTQNELKIQLHYSPLTGLFTRLKQHRTVKIGDIAGNSCTTRNGAIRIGVCGKYYLAHRLAFLYMTGYFPNEIDHIDHNTQNNRWINLREVTHKENGKNQRKYRTNSSGITGVRQRKSGKWTARIYHEGVHINLGTFPDKPTAVTARETKLRELNFHPNHGT